MIIGQELLIMTAITIGTLLIGIVISLLPHGFMDIITKYFSFEKWGMRKIYRRRDWVDTFANTCLFICVIFCFLFAFIPFYMVIYGLMVLFSFLALLGQANRVMDEESKKSRFVVFYCCYLMAAFGFLSAAGVFNNYMLYADIAQFRANVFTNQMLNWYYYLSRPYVAAVFVQAILYMIPMYFIWAQFKYMRLEDTYKGRNLVSFTIKVIFLVLLNIFIGNVLPYALHKAYHVKKVQV